MTLNELIASLEHLRNKMGVNGRSEVEMSSDEEGNDFNPLESIDFDKDRITFFPAHRRLF
jgi:hypothetical protein